MFFFSVFTLMEQSSNFGGYPKFMVAKKYHETKITFQIFFFMFPIKFLDSSVVPTLSDNRARKPYSTGNIF